MRHYYMHTFLSFFFPCMIRKYRLVCICISCKFDARMFPELTEVEMTSAPDAAAVGVRDKDACQTKCLGLSIDLEECVAASYDGTTGTCNMYLGCTLLQGHSYMKIRNESRAGLMARVGFTCKCVVVFRKNILF